MTSKVGFTSGDRISNLSNDILCHILSFVPSSEAVRAGTLSTRWRNLWDSVNVLDVDDGFLSRVQRKNKRKQKDIERNFLNFVKKKMECDNYPSIERLCLSFSVLGGKLASLFVRDAIRRDFRHLDLRFHGEQVELPEKLFLSTSLEVLKLETDYLNVPHSVWLPSLKTLHLNVTKYSIDWYLEVFFSSCPAIEELLLKRRSVQEKKGKQVKGWSFSGWDLQERNAVLDISIPTLKRYEMEFIAWDACETQPVQNYKLVINAPKLEYLRLTDCQTRYFSVIDLRSLVEANVDWQVAYVMPEGNTDCCNQIINLLKGITTVKRLSLSSRTILALNKTSDVDLPIFSRLKRLELGIAGDLDCQFLAKFLHCTPNLEFLTLINKDNIEIGAEGWWTPPQHVPDCLLLCLKEITVEGLHKDYELEAIKHLLQHAEVLTKLTVRCGGVEKHQVDTLFEELSTVSRGSMTCEITLVSTA